MNQPIQVARQLTGFRNTCTITGTVTAGDQLGIAIGDPALPLSSTSPSGTDGAVAPYVVQPGDTLASIAAGLAAAVNADTNLQSKKIAVHIYKTIVAIQISTQNHGAYYTVQNQFQTAIEKVFGQPYL